MILVFEKDSPRLERYLAAGPLPERCLVHDWREFERRAPQALCSVVRIEWLHEGEDVAQLRRFRRRFPCHPIVLATRGCMENARHLCSLMVEEVVWLANADTALADAVQRASACSSLHALGELLGEAQHLPRSLRTALMHACLAHRPVYSVAELAASVHCDRTTLCLQWRKTAGPGPSLRLVDFLGLVLLLHASRRRLAGRRTAEVAVELGVHEHTLRRLTKRLVHRAGYTPAEEGRLITARLHVFARTHLLRTDCESSVAHGVEQTSTDTELADARGRVYEEELGIVARA
ncbi:MAG TPA: hypothetical protein VF746_25330 [Longimicrobium sp.]|jgi:hypothetical protein